MSAGATVICRLEDPFPMLTHSRACKLMLAFSRRPQFLPVQSSSWASQVSSWHGHWFPLSKQSKRDELEVTVVGFFFNDLASEVTHHHLYNFPLTPSSVVVMLGADYAMAWMPAGEDHRGPPRRLAATRAGTSIVLGTKMQHHPWVAHASIFPLGDQGVLF